MFMFAVKRSTLRFRRQGRSLPSLLLIVLLAAGSASAIAAGDPGPAPALLLQTEAGPRPALMTASSIRTEVIGLMARTTLRQTFRNTGGEWVEGRYQFPLPDGAAVDGLVIDIGGRRIEGEIRPKQRARAEFQAARSEGRTAGLVEQHRPGLFTTDLTNIGPEESVTVELRFGHRVEVRHGRFSLRLPMALLPRYGQTGSADAGPEEARLPATPRYDDRMDALHSLTVEIQPGPELATLDSLHHAVDLSPRSDGGWTVALAEDHASMDRDFELEWTLVQRDALSGGFYVEEFDGRTHALLMLVPPASWAPAHRRRELVLVIDRSGSMQGDAIEQARDAMAAALERLQPGDRFNVIAFNNKAVTLFEAPRPVAASTLTEARRFIAALDAEGGTELDDALRLALARPAEDGLLRQVVFATDGSIGAEKAVLDRVRNELGDSRLFTIGIGHGVNATFIRALAREGRGTHTLVNDPDRLARNLAELMDQLERPALEQLSLDWPVADEAWPVLLPDLYAGEALMVLTRLDAPLDALTGHRVTLRGQREGRPLEQRWDLSRFQVASGVAGEWARQKIDGVLDFARDDEKADELRDHALDVAMQYQVLSPVTSLVAVDRTPRRSAEAALQSAATGKARPAGRTMAMPQTATPAARSIAAGLIALLIALLLVTAPRFQRSSPMEVGR
jgi:Ca-activated chloride channel family protein